jgi:predicted transcriptional regulator
MSKASPTVVVSVRLDPKYVKHLKKMAHFLSLERDEDLDHSDLIREAIFNTYPMEQQEESPDEQGEEDKT